MKVLVKSNYEAEFSCDTCGNDLIIVETNSIEDGVFFDGDKMYCSECGAIGKFNCDSEDAYFSWNES